MSIMIVDSMTENTVQMYLADSEGGRIQKKFAYPSDAKFVNVSDIEYISKIIASVVDQYRPKYLVVYIDTSIFLQRLSVCLERLLKTEFIIWNEDGTLTYEYDFDAELGEQISRCMQHNPYNNGFYVAEPVKREEEFNSRQVEQLKKIIQDEVNREMDTRSNSALKRIQQHNTRVR